MSSPTLPQNDSLLEQAARKAQLLASREIYQYENWAGVPMPMATTGAALVSAPFLTSWLEGQVKNLFHIFVNMEVWKILQKFDPLTESYTKLAQDINAVQQSDLSTRFAKTINIKGDVSDSIEHLASSINKMAKTQAVSTDNFTSTASYAKVFELFDTPDIVEQWQDDRIFSSQRLAGLNPMIIQRVSSDGIVGVGWDILKCKLNSKMHNALNKFLPGVSLEQAVGQNRLFVADYVSLAGIVADQDAVGVFAGKRPYAPIVLYVKTDDFPGLNLAAIQLDQNTSAVDQCPVMLAEEATQAGNENKWLMAKALVQAADLSYNQAVNHLGMTHLLEEAFALTSYRQLALTHPLHVLFSFHFEALFAINELGKLTLLKAGPEGLINQLLEIGIGGDTHTNVGSSALITDAYKKWTFDDLDFKAAIAARGLDSHSLPYFPYRDDGEKIWDLLGRYINDYLRIYYKSDRDVVADYELKNWAEELRTTGNVTSLPVIDSIESLVGVVQKLVWTAGPQHASVNFPQVDYTSFMPNYPGAPNFLPSDFNNDTIGKAEFLKMLPAESQTQTQVQISYTLAGFHYNALLDYFDGLSGEAVIVCKKYYAELSTIIEPELIKRNEIRSNQAGLLSYPYFLPSNIPNSTSV